MACLRYLGLSLRHVLQEAHVLYEGKYLGPELVDLVGIQQGSLVPPLDEELADDQEHVHLVESIRLNQKVNQAEDIANSTLVSILGREAAYTGKEISWEEIMASDLRYGPTEYALGPLPDYKEGIAPVPGRDPKAPL